MEKTPNSFVRIEISDKFKEVIKQFEGDSVVARILLTGMVSIEDLVDDHVNYISICNKDRNLISYLDQDKMVQIDDPDFNFWTFKKRVVCKPGGFVKRLFKNIPDKEVEKFSNHYRSIVNKKPMEFKIVSGEDIKKYYSVDTYAQQRGSLGSSCMKYAHCQPFLDFYVKNSDIVSMLVLFDPANYVIGRALLWNFKDVDGKDVKIMDRIYTISDPEYQFKFKSWALENGYLNKMNQNFSDTIGLEKLGDPKIEFKTEVILTNPIAEKYPYLDTFKWLNKKTGTISNYRPEKSDDIVTLACPDGNTQNFDYLNLCDVNRTYHYGHEIVHLQYAKKTVYVGLTNYSESNNTHILKSDAVYNDEVRDWIFKDDEKNDQKALKNRIEYFKKREASKEKTNDVFPSEIRWGSTQGVSGISSRSTLNAFYGAYTRQQDPVNRVVIDTEMNTSTEFNTSNNIQDVIYNSETGVISYGTGDNVVSGTSDAVMGDVVREIIRNAVVDAIADEA